MLVEPFGEMGGMAKAETVGDFLQWSGACGQQTAGGLDLSPIEVGVRCDTQLGRQQLFHPTRANVKPCGEFAHVQGAHERPSVKTAHEFIDPLVKSTWLVIWMNAELNQGLNIDRKPDAKGCFSLAPRGKGEVLRLTRFPVGHALSCTVDGTKEAAGGLV